MTRWLTNLLWMGILIGMAACSTATSTFLIPTAVIQPPLISPTAPPEMQVQDTLPPQPEEMASTPTPSPVTPDTSHDDWFYTSPDGQWTVQVSAEFPIAADGSLSGERYRLSLSVFRKDGSLRWNVLDEERPFGPGYTLPAQFHWSKDGTQLFYTEHGVLDGVLTMVGYDCGLYRIDLPSGERTQLSADCGLLRAAGDGETFAVLQGSRLLIYATNGQTLREIAFTNLLQLDDQSDWQAGGLIWSPENGRLAFSVLKNLQQPAEIRTSFVLVDLLSGVVRYVSENRAGQYLPIEWGESDSLLVLDAFGLRYRLNIRTGELTPDG